MELQEIKQQIVSFAGSNPAELHVDFYRKMSAFTENLTGPQLLILRDHIHKMSTNLSPKASNDKSIISKRETEVLILLTNGYNRRDIGSSLGISANTAARHIANIYQKLGISCVAEATHYAISHQIIS